MIEMLRCLTVKQLAERQDHMVMSPTDFGEAQAKANMRGYKKGREEAIEEVEEAFEEHLFDSPLMNPFMTRNEILLLLEQLKEQNNE